jgi:hypothetical protein
MSGWVEFIVVIGVLALGTHLVFRYENRSDPTEQDEDQPA